MKSFNGYKKAGIFVVIAAMAAMAMEGYTPSTLDNVKDIWNSPSRLEAIENDIDLINERLSLVTLDENREESIASR